MPLIPVLADSIAILATLCFNEPNLCCSSLQICATSTQFRPQNGLTTGVPGSLRLGCRKHGEPKTGWGHRCPGVLRSKYQSHGEYLGVCEMYHGFGNFWPCPAGLNVSHFGSSLSRLSSIFIDCIRVSATFRPSEHRV